MGHRRTHRGLAPRTDLQILDHPDDLHLLAQINHAVVTMEPIEPMTLRRLAREDFITVGFAAGSPAAPLPRSPAHPRHRHRQLPPPLPGLIQH